MSCLKTKRPTGDVFSGPESCMLTSHSTLIRVEVLLQAFTIHGLIFPSIHILADFPKTTPGNNLYGVPECSEPVLVNSSVCTTDLDFFYMQVFHVFLA